nr:hypothetical protein [Shewanella algae]
MPNMTRLLNFLLMLGCDRCAIKTRERKVIQVNLGVLVSVTTILLFILGFYISGNQGFILSGLNQLPFVALLPLVLLLNYKGKFFAARWCLMLLLMADAATALMTAQGTSIKIHSYYLLFAIMLVVLFEIREWRSILILMLANLGLFSFFELHGWPSHPDIALLSTHTLAILKGSSRISGERLSDFQKEVFGIPVAIAHSLQQFDFVVHPFQSAGVQRMSR